VVKDHQIPFVGGPNMRITDPRYLQKIAIS